MSKMAMSMVVQNLATNFDNLFSHMIVVVTMASFVMIIIMIVVAMRALSGRLDGVLIGKLLEVLTDDKVIDLNQNNQCGKMFDLLNVVSWFVILGS